MYKSPLMVCCW